MDISLGTVSHRFRLTLLLLACMLIGLVSVVDSATYWVSQSSTGNGNACTNSATPLTTTAKLTIAGGLGCLSPGDTLMIRAGPYSEHDLVIPNGTAGNVVTVRAAPGETVTIQAPSGTAWQYLFDMSNLSAPSSYLVVGSPGSTLILDCNGTSESSGAKVGIEIDQPSHHITVQHTEVKNCRNLGISLHPNGSANFSSNTLFLNNNVHDNGYWYPDPNPTVFHSGHGYYFGLSDGIIDGGSIHHNPGHGLQFYEAPDSGQGAPNRNIIRNVNVHHNGSGPAGGPGIGIYWGDQNQVYNNVVAQNHDNGINIFGYNTVVYSNTVYQNSGFGIYERNDFGGAQVKNNIAYLNTGPQIDVTAGSSVVQTNTTSDPFFSSPAGGDYHLSVAGSPAVNAGQTLGGIYAVDLEGLVRPAGFYSTGAYQFAGQPQEPTPDPGDLLAEWLFNEGSGTTAADTAAPPLGGIHPCTLTSAGWSTPGIIGPSAFLLNGTRSCQISNVTNLTPVAIAISLWLNGTVLPASGAGCLYTTDDSIELCINGSGQPMFTIFTDTYHTITGPTSVQNGVAHHLVASYHATDGMRLWVDGAQVAFGASTGPLTYPSGTLTQIGRYFTNNTNAYTGVIDQVRAYFGPLTQSAVTNLFNENVSAPGMSLTHTGWYAANQPEGIALGPLDSDRSHVLTTPLGMRFAVHKADTGALTEYLRPYCRVLASPGGSLVLDWSEVTNSFGTLGVRYLADSAVTQGQATSVLLPTGGFTGLAGKFLINPIDTTSPYDAAQRQTIAQGQHAEQEIRVEIGSPRVAGQVVQCKLRRENGVDFDSYGGAGDPIIKSLLLQAVAPPTNVRIGGIQQGGTQ